MFCYDIVRLDQRRGFPVCHPERKKSFVKCIFSVANITVFRYKRNMPKKIRELVRDLNRAGWMLERGGKGSHRKFSHGKIARKLILSGQDGADAKRYQERDVQQAINEAKEAK